MKVSLLYGTETGNAEMLCEDIEENLDGIDDVETANLEDTAPGDLQADRFYLMVCSTYGEGELPQSAIPFVDALKEEATDLSGIRFAVFGLGDTNYDQTYNNGSVVLTQALTAAGAKAIGERGLHDASGLDDAIDIALPWAVAQIAEAKKHYEE
ncbi:MAG: flavodoxin domain-containing protein [Pseudomonadota bacterium]